MFIFIMMANCTKPSPTRERIKCFLMLLMMKLASYLYGLLLFALFVNGRRSSSSHRFGSLASWHLLVGSHELKFVMVADINHNLIKGGTLKRCITLCKLYKEVLVA